MTDARQHVASPPPTDNPLGRGGDILATIEAWRQAGITVAEAWLMVTGRRIETGKNWDIVERAMRRIAEGKPAVRAPRGPSKRKLSTAPPPPVRFTDCPIAARDHGSPGRVARPPTLTARQSSAAL